MESRRLRFLSRLSPTVSRRQDARTLLDSPCPACRRERLAASVLLMKKLLLLFLSSPMLVSPVPMDMASPTPMLLLLSLLLSQRLPRWRFPSTSTRLSTRRWSWLLFVTMAWDLLFLVLKNIAEAE